MSKKLSKKERDRLNTQKFNTPEARERKRKLEEDQISELPSFITCNDCGGLAPRETFELLPTKDIPGVDLAFFGVCSDCNALTVAATGEKNAVATAMEILNRSMG